MAKHSQDEREQRTSEPITERVVISHPDSIHVREVDDQASSAEVHRRFGGLDPFAVAAGILAAIGLLSVIGAIATAVGRFFFDDRAERDLALAGLITGLVALLLAALAGGYVAGRVARYEGKRNGLLTGLGLILLTALMGSTALAFDRVRDLELPSWLDDRLGLISLLTALAAAAVVLLASSAAGGAGARWHRKVDSLLLRTRAGGVVQPTAGTKTTGSLR